MVNYQNGRAPDSALVHLFGCVASPDMARRVAATKRDFELETGSVLIINEIYRTYERQIEEKQRWTDLGEPDNAAEPGWSKHGAWLIGAVDWSCIGELIPARRNIALRYGLEHDIPNETWHATKTSEGFRTLPELSEFASLTPTPIPEELMPLNETDLSMVAALSREAARIESADALRAKVYRLTDGVRAGRIFAFNKTNGAEWDYPSTATLKRDIDADKTLGLVGDKEGVAAEISVGNYIQLLKGAGKPIPEWVTTR